MRGTTDQPREQLDARSLVAAGARDRRRARIDRRFGRAGREQRRGEHDQRAGARLAALLGELDRLTSALHAVGAQAEREIDARQLAQQADREIVAATARERRDPSAQLREAHDGLAIRVHGRSIQPTCYRAAVSDHLARAALERAEREPLLGHRGAAVRAASTPPRRCSRPPIRSCARGCCSGSPSVTLVEGDYEAADQALAAVGRHAPDDTVLRFLAGIRACRVAIGAGPMRALARDTLLRAAARLPSFDDPGKSPTGEVGTGWEVVTAEVALAIAELALHDDPPDASAFEPIGQLVTELTDRDVAYAGHLLLAAYALSIGEPERAVRSLRAAVPIARDAASPADEIESRLALAGALVAMGDPISRDEPRARSTTRSTRERHASSSCATRR